MESAGQMQKHREYSLGDLEKNMVVETVPVPVAEERFVKIVLLIDSTVKITGVYSGRGYTFNGAGSEQDVDERDVEWLLERRQGRRQCCGGSATGNVVFALVGE